MADAYICRRGGSGGSGGGSELVIVGGTTSPAKAGHNTIWLNTPNTITSYVLTATEPTGPVEGMAWITIGASGGVKMAAPVGGEWITVYPISAKQFTGGAWADMEAKCYHNGEWVDWVRYFYRDGNTYNEVTGGWGHTKYESAYGAEAAVTFESNRIKVTSSSDTSYVTFVHTKNKVDVSNISQISVKLDIVKEFYQKILVIDDGTTGNTPIASRVITGDSAELDVSAYSENYYVGVVFKNIGAQVRTSEAYITEVLYS